MFSYTTIEDPDLCLTFKSRAPQSLPVILWVLLLYQKPFILTNENSRVKGILAPKLSLWIPLYELLYNSKHFVISAKKKVSKCKTSCTLKLFFLFKISTPPEAKGLFARWNKPSYLVFKIKKKKVTSSSLSDLKIMLSVSCSKQVCQRPETALFNCECG